jgi:hypothetical protein
MQYSRVSAPFTYLLPRLRDVLFAGIFIAVIVHGPRLFNLDGDLGRHITIGNYILQTKSIPTQDVFSHTMAGEPLVPHEWLAQTTFSLVNSLMGLSGVVLLTALIIAFTFTLIYEEMIRRGVFRLVALSVTVWAAMASSLHWLARPHVFTFLFIAIWAFALECLIEKKSASIWPFPVVMLIWANTHGAFIAGFIVLGAYYLEWLWEFLHGQAEKEKGRALTMIGGTSFAVTFLNPAGYHLWETSVGYAGESYLVDHTVEYMSPNFHLPATWPFLFMIVFFLLRLGFAERMRFRHAVLLAGWAIMGLFSTRNIPLFAIVNAPVLAILVQDSLKNLKFPGIQDSNLKVIEQKLRGFLWPILIVLLIAYMLARDVRLDGAQLGNRYDPSIFPVQAVDWLKAHPQQGNVFNHFTWGGYLLLRTWPEVPVFIDGQTDFYGEELTRDYERVITLSDGWEDIIKKYDIEWVIIPTAGRLARELRNHPGRKIMYEDGTAVIMRLPQP